jgi:CMP-N-acetylneuraminic acid synthetase
MHIGVIPARAGSKRFPGKNRAKLNGAELWRIAVEKSAQTTEITITNTDDKRIFEKGIIRFVRYERPEHLRNGAARIDDVLIEMATTLKWKPDDIIHLLQPTNPFVSIKTILKGRELFKWREETKSPVDSVQSVWKVPNTLHAYSQRMIINGNVEFMFPELRSRHYNSQKKPDFYAFAGYVACKVGSLLNYNNIWGKRSLGIEVNQIEAIDIDTVEDLEFAERLAGTTL